MSIEPLKSIPIRFQIYFSFSYTSKRERKGNPANILRSIFEVDGFVKNGLIPISKYYFYIHLWENEPYAGCLNSEVLNVQLASTQQTTNSTVF